MNTPTPTPRTDAEWKRYVFNDEHYSGEHFARTLERELAEAKRENYDMLTRLDSQELRAEKQYREIAKERDAWRECADELASEYLLRQSESAYDAEAELEGANKALAAYDKLKEETK